jgi:hypothetical protein
VGIEAKSCEHSSLLCLELAISFTTYKPLGECNDKDKFKLRTAYSNIRIPLRLFSTRFYDLFDFRYCLTSILRKIKGK